MDVMDVCDKENGSSSKISWSDERSDVSLVFSRGR